MRPESVLGPERNADVATWLAALMAPSADYRRQSLRLIYVIADAASTAPFAPRVRAFLRYTVTLGDTNDPEARKRAHAELSGRVRWVSDWLSGLYSFIPVPASALDAALSAPRCTQPLAALRYVRPLPVGVSLTPPHITPTLDYLAGRPGCAALEFRVELRSPLPPVDTDDIDDTDEAPLRFGVVALGEAAHDVTLARLSAELCGGHTPQNGPVSDAAPVMTCLRPSTSEQRDFLYMRLTAPADELAPLLNGAPAEDVTLTLAEAGGRLAMPHLLF